MVYKNYYKILELETSRVSIDDIKMAYRAAAKKYHPDLNVGDNLAEEKIKDINEAYKILSEPSSKRKYDRIWNSKFSKEEKAFSGKGQKKAIINMLIGNIDKIEKKEKKNPIRGENINTEINISLKEGFLGLQKSITLKEENSKTKTFTITIPKGIQNGEKVRLIGQGKKGENGGKAGDLLIKIKVEDSDKFKLKGKDLYTDLLLTPWEAALGAKAEINTIDEKTKIFIPKGIQSGEIIKIPEKGYISDKGSRGDLIAKVKIMVPKELTKEERECELYIYIDRASKEISKFNPRNIKKGN